MCDSRKEPLMRTGRSHTRVSSRRSSETRLHLNRVGTGGNCNWVECGALEIHSILAVFIEKHNRAARPSASRLCLLDRSFPGNEDRSLGERITAYSRPTLNQ